MKSPHAAQERASAATHSGGPELTKAAQRALAEAEERHRQRQSEAVRPQEVNGRGGLDPARYGDWEVKGITSDF